MPAPTKFSTWISAIKEGSKNFKREEKHPIPIRKVKKLLYNVNREIKNKILSGEEVRLPSFIGSLRIEKKKMTKFDKKHLYMDYGHFNKTGKKIVHLNEHRNGFYYRIKWCKGHITGISAYKFFPVRYFQRELAKRLKSDNNLDYKQY